MEQYHLYIVLTRTNSIVSKIIRLVKDDEYTHASISLDKELNRMYSFGRKYTCFPFIGRFKHEYIYQGLYKRCKTLPGVIIELEVTKEQYNRAELLLDQFISNSNLYKYNYMGFVYNLLNLSTRDEYRYLCSEFVYYIINELGIVDLKKSPNLVRPQNLLYINGKIIYKGDLKLIKSFTDYRNGYNPADSILL